MKHFASLLERLSTYASRSCIECVHGTHTYAQLVHQLESWLTQFDQFNVQPGSVVGLRTDYSSAAFAAILALWSRRAIAALIPRDADAAQCLSDARATACLDLGPDGTYNWVPMSSDGHRLIDQLRAAGDGGLVIFTSGSTGHPKAALQSTERFLHKFRTPGRPFRTLAFLVFDHIGGLDTSFYTLGSGGTLILTQRRDPRTILTLIESRKVEVLPTSPSFLRMLRASREIAEFDLSSLKIITYGSEPMDPSTLAYLNAVFPHLQIVQKYGTTETGSPKTVSRGNDSLWIKVKADGVETKVVDGILWIRSQSTILGYLNATSPLDQAGWYCTGDLVDIDGEWIRFRGRAVNTINVGGEKVTPAEVEQTILELDFVRDVMAAGQSHAVMGQVVVVQVALRSSLMDRREAATRIRNQCRNRLALYKVPVKIDFVEELPVSSRQKVQRRRISD